jgi:hypothetical protein
MRPCGLSDSLRLRKLGHDSTLLVEKQSSDDPSVTQFLTPMDLRSRTYRRVRGTPIARDLARYESSRHPDTIFSLMTEPVMPET